MKLSIITINRNNAEGLRKTIGSVVSQSVRDFEYIVIDGASTDGSVDVIKENEDRIDQWVSEPDKGIYDAMNKGMNLSRGTYALMLNSGDYFVEECVVERILPQLLDEDILQGNVLYEKGEVWMRDKGFARSRLRLDEIFMAYFPHQACFIRKDLWKTMGGYDIRLKKHADSAFFMEALAFRNARYRYVDIDVSVFDCNGVTSISDSKSRKDSAEEMILFSKEKVPMRVAEFIEETRTPLQWYELSHRNALIGFCARTLFHIAKKLCKCDEKIYIEKIEKRNS